MFVPRREPGPRFAALMGFFRAAEALWHASRAFFARWEISPSQFNVLHLLHAAPDGLSQSALSRQLVMHRSNVTGPVDRLERHGWVGRHADATDRRAWCVVLTPAGRRLIDEILPHYYAVVEEVWGAVPVPRARRVGVTLHQIQRHAAALALRYSHRPA